MVFSNHPIDLQLLFYAFILTSFWMVELLWFSQNAKSKLQHSILNIKFLFFAVPVQLTLTGGLLFAANWVDLNHFGILGLFSLSLSSFLYYFLGFILIDLFGYLYHIMMHKIPVFWKFHLIHHCDMDVDISSTIREHPGETFVRVCFFILVVLIVGVSPALLLMNQFIQTFSNLVSHSKIRLPHKLNKILSLVFVTPNTHHIHHHYLLPQTDSNYGDILTIWDRLFATFCSMKQSEIIYGVDTNMNEIENSNFINLLKRPFKK